MLKIFLIYRIKNIPWGGGNQFLKALIKEWQKSNIYTENPTEANCFLFNSHQNIEEVIFFKKKFPHKLFIHRLDGPIYIYRRDNLYLDRLIFEINKWIADGTIFQSKWSRDKSYRLGYKRNKYESIIYNSVDGDIFYSEKNNTPPLSDKFKIISVSWSTNPNKGFNYLEWLDNNLDFKQYTLTFVGRSPNKFKNIRMFSPMKSKELANIMREHHIYLNCSEIECCSNSIVEALSCGLPVLSKRGSSNFELVGKAGEYFSSEREIIPALEKIKNNYRNYCYNIRILPLSKVAEKYYNFVLDIYRDYKKGIYAPKRIKFNFFLKYFYIKFMRKIVEASKFLTFFFNKDKKYA